MNAIQTFRSEEYALVRDASDERRPALAVVAASAFSECTCPGDCDRDHDNE
jgi:hypothetical protein